MGEAKRKQYSGKVFLKENPYCCYCGDPATTTDHCPPRSMFIDRQWPETYEFPACKSCNDEARKDEQILAILTRISFTKDRGDQARAEWNKLFVGLANNQPDVVREWQNIGPSRIKRGYRDMFGATGDSLRHQGYGSINLGPISKLAIRRFMVKLGQALYYKHCEAIFEGDIIYRHMTMLSRHMNEDVWENIVRIAPLAAEPTRARKSLNEQFMYRFNFSPTVGAMYAVVGFSEQMHFQIIAAREDLAVRLRLKRPDLGVGIELPVQTVKLKRQPAPR